MSTRLIEPVVTQLALCSVLSQQVIDEWEYTSWLANCSVAVSDWTRDGFVWMGEKNSSL